MFVLSKRIRNRVAAALSLCTCALLAMGVTSPASAANRDPWVRASVQFNDIVDAEPDGRGGLWVLEVERSGYPNDLHRLVRVDSRGHKSPTTTTVAGPLADSEELDPDGEGGVVIVGPFDIQATDTVVGVTSQGSQYSLKAPCAYEMSVGDGSGGAWIQCLNSTKYAHLTVDGQSEVMDFANANASVRIDGAWMVYPDGAGGFWGFVWEKGGSWNEPQSFQLASVDRQGLVHFDSRTYTGRGDSPSLELNHDGSIRIGNDPRVATPGFASTTDVPRDIGNVDTDCGIGGASVRCLIPFGLGSAEWRPGSREWRITSRHPAEPPGYIVGDSVVGSQHVWGLGATWWKSDRKGRVSTLRLHNSAPDLWPAIDLASGGVRWWQTNSDLYAVNVRRIPWKRLPGRVQTVTIASPETSSITALPRKTDQGTVVRWRSTDKSKCAVQSGRITWRGNYCPLVARAAGTAPWAPFRAQFKLLQRGG